MLFYPAYTVEMVLNEYAIRFFALLEQGHRNRSGNYHMLAQLQLVPNMPKEARTKFLKSLEYAAADPNDILKPKRSSDDGDNERKLKRLFGQR